MTYINLAQLELAAGQRSVAADLFAEALSLDPSSASVLTTSVDWFPDVRPWIDLNLAESFLFNGQVTGEQWANVAVTAGVWIILPALLGLRLAMRSEVK